MTPHPYDSTDDSKNDRRSVTALPQMQISSPDPPPADGQPAKFVETVYTPPAATVFVHPADVPFSDPAVSLPTVL